MKSILIRTFGGKGIGYGHFYRCLSLAKAIKLISEDINIIFLINQDLKDLLGSTGFNFVVSNNLNEDNEKINRFDISLFIFDSYLGDNRYLKMVKEKTKLMLIDDNNDIYDTSIPDIIYNGNIHAEKLGYFGVRNQLQLLGPKFLIMKEEYWNRGTNKNVIKDGILITTGGTDEYGVSLRILEQLKNLGSKIKVIIGPGYKDDYIRKIEDSITDNIKLIYKPNSLKDYILSSKIVITAGGSTAYEILSQKSLPIIFSLVDNQDLICNELSNMGVKYLGKHPDINYSLLEGKIKELQKNGLSENNKIYDLVDGKGAKLVASRIVEEI
ncbi:PseG/SpsG family protein [Clostridium sp. Cult2]|uniref:PseG/SpsG family protein n=1 Tax=Clostridium sp. Cult2 TaxID=2079003 RepID=UPI001F22D0DF|nr:hypothetical protein [Clostridium sp. Cult2]MCF6465229.1 hypothetical protein [Clostridium sp. Cult2]